MVIPLLSSFGATEVEEKHLLGGSVVLNELAVLHLVAGAHPVDLLVHLSPGQEGSLSCFDLYFDHNIFRCSLKCLKVYYQTPPMARRGVSESFNLL